MAIVSLTDAIAGYFFWLWCGQPWNLDKFRGHFYDRALFKILKKHGVNKQEYEMLAASKAQILAKLMKES